MAGTGLVSSFVLGAVRDYHYGGDVIWLDSSANGFRAAEETHRPVLISFHSSDCDWCRKMDAEAFTDSKVVALTHDYVCVRVDARRDPETVNKYHVTEFPVTLVTDETGKPLTHLDGYADATQVATLLQSELLHRKARVTPNR